MLKSQDSQKLRLPTGRWVTTKVASRCVSCCKMIYVGMKAYWCEGAQEKYCESCANKTSENKDNFGDLQQAFDLL